MDHEFSLKVYGQKAFDILQAAFQYSSYHLRRRGFLVGASLVRKLDNEVVIVTNCEGAIPKDPYANLAYALKEVLWRKTEWKTRGSNFKNVLDLEFSIAGTRSTGIEYLYDRESYKVTTTVREVRCLYEIILGRDEKKIISTYGEKTFREMKGEPADCFASTQKEIYIQEMKTLKQQREDELKQIKDEYKKRLGELAKWEKEMEEKTEQTFDKKVTDLKMKFDKTLIQEIDSSNMSYLKN